MFLIQGAYCEENETCFLYKDVSYLRVLADINENVFSISGQQPIYDNGSSRLFIFQTLSSLLFYLISEAAINSANFVIKLMGLDHERELFDGNKSFHVSILNLMIDVNY